MPPIIIENYTKKQCEIEKILIYAKLFFVVYSKVKDVFELFNSLWKVKKISGQQVLILLTLGIE
jgi:hypothetical protein